MAETPTAAPPGPFNASTWSDAHSHESLRLVVESVTQMVGFDTAAIRVVVGDQLFGVTVAGPPAVREKLEGASFPLSFLYDQLVVAEDWGRFHFLPHDRVPSGFEDSMWIPDLAPSDDPDAWHQLDSLLAPLYGEDGELLGLLSIDVPTDGLRPGATQRELLERYAEQAERALTMAVEREALSQRLRLAEAARQIVRFAVSKPDIEHALDQCAPALQRGFRADEISVRTYAGDGMPRIRRSTLAAPAAIQNLVEALSRVCWAEQRVEIISTQPLAPSSDRLGRYDHPVLAEVLLEAGYDSAMLVPIGSSSWALGHLMLYRRDPHTPWAPAEQEACLDVARDIGLAVLNARSLAREQQMVGELRELASYKTELLSTVSHELKNPLGALRGHLEMIAAKDDLSSQVRHSLVAIDRASTRLSRVVDGLLTLAEVDDPDATDGFEVVDLRPVVESATELVRLSAERRGLELVVSVPPDPLLARGDPFGLDQVLVNLIGNAVKYTPGGGSIHIDAALDPESGLTRITVTDEGIGISAEDQDHLFAEFFRSTNPAALAVPGTGLGLAICARIVRRHGGRIELDSRPGEGSTFRVLLPPVDD